MTAAAALRAVSQLAQDQKRFRVDILWASGGQEEESRKKKGKKNTNSGVQKWVKWRLEVSITHPDGERMDAWTHARAHTLRLTPLLPSSNENHVWPRGGKGGGFTPQTRCATSSGVAPLTDTLRTHSVHQPVFTHFIQTSHTDKKTHEKSALFL